MGDVLLLFLAALIVIGGGVAVALTVRAGKRKRALDVRDRARRLRRELSEIDEYIRGLGQAASDDDLDRLERDKEQ